VRIADRCYAVTGLAYSPPWCVNAGFVVGDCTTLVIDTGGNALAAATIHGYATAMRPSNALQVINSEKHFDHINGNNFFLDRGAKIWAHAGVYRTEQEFLQEKKEFNECIPNPARRAAHEEDVFFTGTRRVNPTHLLHEETELDLGNCVARVLFTPGHTATNLCLWVPQDRVLFTGDCLINCYIPNLDAGGPPDWRTWLRSLDRIEALEPKAILAGHGPVAQGGEVQTIFATVRHVLQQSIARGSSPTASSGS
jgi:glyoxylase-like metal-dependent hydrolase (beta-lactamase superfamily II)